MRQQAVERSEVVARRDDGAERGSRRLRAEQRAVSFLADADVQPENARTIQLRGTVEIAVILGDDGGERKPLRWREIAAGVVAEKRIPPRDLRRPRLARGDVDIDAGECCGDVLADGGLVHGSVQWSSAR
jgi:hypothetical protein